VAKNKKKEIVLDTEATGIDSFKAYQSSDDGRTKIVDGEKVIDDFHMYKEE